MADIADLPPGETLFITLRLAGSVPMRAARELHQQRQAAQEAARAAPDFPAIHRRIEKQFFVGFDALLNAATVGSVYLEKEKVADVVAGELLMLEEQGFMVPCFAVLPNHVHAVLHQPASSNLSVHKALELLHQRTAAQARRILRGQLPAEADFWQTGTYDYAIADAAELVQIQRYILGHAARLKIPERYHDWPYVYSLPPSASR
ncbi:hypothetical protein [Hymenobacter sp.]|jgi:hypothetical protein|uniref:hypothetical protein n=1 Tax=Hymenobacter sp. TaxID=1898978 RepID=UPI002ED86221